MPSVSNPALTPPQSASPSLLVPVQWSEEQGQILSNNRPLVSTDLLGLTVATQTQCQKIEAQSLTYVGSPTVTLASFTNGPGVMSRFQLITQYTSAYTANSSKALLFSIYVDGEATPSIQFDADLWGASQMLSTTPNTSIPYVLESDYLTICQYIDSGGDFNNQFIFKYPVPFSQSLVVTMQNQAAGVSFLNLYWSAVDVQMGLYSPRRLKSQFTSCLSPLQIPSAVPWSGGQTFATGNLCQYNNALYQSLTSSNTGNTPSSSPANWAVVSATANPNFNTGYPLVSVAQPAWLAHFTLGGQGPVNGGTYGSQNANVISFLESNLAVYDGNLTPAPSFPGNSPTPSYNSSGTEDFFGGSFYFASISTPAASESIGSTPFTFRPAMKLGQLRHGYCMGNASAFMNANVSLQALTGGIKCGTSMVLRWEGGSSANTGPIAAGNTWNINPTILYYV